MTRIVLDTCVVSETKRPDKDPRAEAWYIRQDAERLFLTATVVGELASSIMSLPAGKRRTEFELWLDTLVNVAFAGRVLPFDQDSALRYGNLVALARSQGRPSQVADTQIAAVALRYGMTVATRNMRDFEVFGVPLVNPWEPA